MTYFLLILLLAIVFTKLKLGSLIRLYFLVSPLFTISILSFGNIAVNPALLLSVVILPLTLIKWVRFGRTPVMNSVDMSWLLFVFISILSIAVNMPKEGNVIIFGSPEIFYGFENNTQELKFGEGNLIRILLLLWYIIFSFTMAANIQKLRLLYDSILYFLVGTVVAMSFSIILLICYNLLGPDSVRNVMTFLSSDFSVEEYGARINQYKTIFGVTRLNTIVGEPSFTSSLILVTLGLSRYMYVETRQRKFVLIGVFLAFCLVFVNSSLGYFGLSIAMTIYLLMRIFRNMRAVILIIVVVVLLGGLVLYYASFAEHLNFFSTPRYKSIQFSFNLFLENSMLGLGYGSQRSTAFLLNVLVGVGVLGTLIFCLPFIFRISDINRFYMSASKPKSSAVMFLLSFYISTWVILLVGVPYVAFFFPWTWITFYLPLGGLGATNK